MPPERPQLNNSQVRLIAEWIDNGAIVSGSAQDGDGTHWAFRPIERPSLPSTLNASWANNPIDVFILNLLERKKIQPAPRAKKQTLIRRAYLDLIGLPPNRMQLREALNDTSPGAYERMIERLLASPHYGEKWARHWLDQVRYADSDGFERDHERPHAWRYRNWVIDALNANQSFADFTREQIAGDLIPFASVDQIVATGMLRCAPFNR